VVGLDAADRDERVAALRERFSNQVFEFSGLVATERESTVAILTLGPDLRATSDLVRRSRGCTGDGPNRRGCRAKVASFMGLPRVRKGYD